MATTTATTPARCEATSASGKLGCARSAAHEGSCWLTSTPEAARASLLGQGFFARTPDCAGCASCDPAEAAREEAAWNDGSWD